MLSTLSCFKSQLMILKISKQKIIILLYKKKQLFNLKKDNIRLLPKTILSQLIIQKGKSVVTDSFVGHSSLCSSINYCSMIICNLINKIKF